MHFSFRRQGRGLPQTNPQWKEKAMKAARNLILALLGLVAVGVDSMSAWAQPVGGALHRTTSVDALGTDSFQATFRGGELAIVMVRGDGDTDLDLYVYDEAGKLVASDTDLTDQCVVTWVPRWTGRFIIRVVNRGYVSNLYRITAG
jgi:hypothetical protein